MARGIRRPPAIHGCEFRRRTQDRRGLVPPGKVSPTEALRIAARCETSRCVHFDGQRCALARKIVDELPEVVDALSACSVRSSCRWYAEQGRAACLRCPQVVTLRFDPVNADGSSRVRLSRYLLEIPPRSRQLADCAADPPRGCRGRWCDPDRGAARSVHATVDSGACARQTLFNKNSYKLDLGGEI